MNKKHLFSFFILALAAFGLRFFIAAVFPQWTYESDMMIYRNWIYILQHAPFREYYRIVTTEFITPYPPLFLYVLKLLGTVIDAVARPDLVVKLPGTLADIGIGAVLFLYGHKHWGARNGLLAAAVFLFNPAVMLVSAVWGQTDSLYSLPLLAAFIAAAAGRPALAGAAGAASALLKVQGAVFLPLLFTVIAVYSRKNFWRALLSAVAVSVIALLPFIISGRMADVVAVYISHSVAKYPWVSVYAWNFWWPLATTVSNLRLPDTGTIFGTSFFSVGTMLFGAAYIAIVAAVWTKRLAPLGAAALLAFSFFMLPTEIHERYIFPTLVFLPLLFAGGRLFQISYAALSVTFAANLFFVLPFLPEPERLLAQPATISAWLLTNTGWIINGVVFVALAAHAARTALKHKTQHVL